MKRGTNSITVKGAEPVATASTSPARTAPIRLEGNAAYKAWVVSEPSDMNSPEWEEWINRWPG